MILSFTKNSKGLYDVSGRTVISNCGFCTENISSFLDCHFQSIAQRVKSYIKDTNHLLNMVNKIGKLPKEAILCTHQFLDPTSSHPYHFKKGILYSQNLRLNRICSSDNEKFDIYIYICIYYAITTNKKSVITFAINLSKYRECKVALLFCYYLQFSYLSPFLNVKRYVFNVPLNKSISAILKIQINFTIDLSQEPFGNFVTASFTQYGLAYFLKSIR